MSATVEEKARMLERLSRREVVDDAERAVLREAAALFRSTAKEESRRAEAEAAKRACAPKDGAAPGTGEHAVLWSDGASRGNPGRSGIGAVLKRPSGETLAEVSQYIGEATNNVAEYKAVVAGLERAVELGVGSIEVRADSELMIKQLLGRYRVKAPHIMPLFERARALLGRFASHRLTHVPREQNSEADRLANRGIDDA